jgi:hypothetical protein
MRFSWTGILVAPLLVPALASAAMAGTVGGPGFPVSFLILFVPGCVISYATTIFVFLPCLFLVSTWRRLTGFTVCLLGLVLGALAFLPLTGMAWLSSGPDSGPPAESFFTFFPRWVADPFTAIFPLAGLITAGLYWGLGSWRQGQAKPALVQGQ